MADEDLQVLPVRISGKLELCGRYATNFFVCLVDGTGHVNEGGAHKSRISSRSGVNIVLVGSVADDMNPGGDSQVHHPFVLGAPVIDPTFNGLFDMEDNFNRCPCQDGNVRYAG